MSINDYPALNVHGIEYPNSAMLTARIAELAYGNWKHGESDGRVTELNAIFEGLESMSQAELPEDTHPIKRGRHVLASMEYLFKMLTWLGSHNAPVNPVQTEMDVAAGNTLRGIVPQFRNFEF